jgi:hypothetical protein
MSIFKDGQVSCLTINDILLVRGKIVTPLIESNVVVETNGQPMPNMSGNVIEAKQELIVGTGDSKCTIVSGLTTPHTYTLPEVGANAEFLMTEGAQTANGTKTFNDGIRFLTSGGLVTTLNNYEENSINPLGFTSNTFIGTVNRMLRITKIGNLVNLRVTALSTAANGGADDTIQTVVGVLPERFRPLSDTRAPCTIVQTLAILGCGQIEVLTTGQIRFYYLDTSTNQFGNFLLANTFVGWSGVNITYSIA